MNNLIFNIFISVILISSFASVHYAYADFEVSLTPDDFINPWHTIIIDIDTDVSPPPSKYPINIQVKDGETGNDLDNYQKDVNYDPLWGKYRLLIKVVIGDPIDDNKIQAHHGDTIEVQYDDAVPSEWPKVIVHDITGSTPTDDRLTFSTKINCTNDADGDPDTDGDGVCDVWEDNTSGLLIVDDDGEDPKISGSYFYDCSLTHAEGCGSGKPDIFVEIDWMESHRPDPFAIKQVVDSFDNAGIRLHIQVDPNSTQSHLSNFEFPGYDIDGYRGFDQLKAGSFGTCVERNPSEDCNDPGPEWGETKKLKHQVFHYGFFAHKMAGDAYQTGVAEIAGNDFFVTLGKYTGAIGSADQQAGTLMHELGHNLGLNHGGGEFDEVNNKPNLFSVMSYSRQFSDFDSNRNLDFSNANLGHPVTTDDTTIPYDDATLHENKIQGFKKGIFMYQGHTDEPIIFSCPDGQVAPVIYLTGKQGGVDWDCDGDPTTRGLFDLNIDNLPIGPNSDYIELEGHYDWDALNYDFSNNVGNYADGRHSKVASGFVQTEGDGIPFGEDLASLATKGGPDLNYNFTATGTTDLTFEGITLNRISNLLSLYRQIDMFDEDDFDHGFSELSSTYSIEVGLPVGSGVSGCEINDECYVPSVVTIPVDTKVIWANDDSASHTVTSGTPSGGPSGLFDSELFATGSSYSFVFEEVGSYDYFCMVHPWMVGEIIVVASSLEPFEDSYKAGVIHAINQINIHDIPGANSTVNSIDDSLETSLDPKNYDLINPITTNLGLTYAKALGFGFLPTPEDLTNRIIHISEINGFVEDVESFVDELDQDILYCGAGFEVRDNLCQCAIGEIEDAEGDCVPGEVIDLDHVVPPISISTDKSVYNYGEQVTVDGKVKEILFGHAIVILMLSPNGNVISIDQVMVDSQKLFYSEFTTGGPLMGQAGDYKIKAHYGKPGAVAETTFSFAGSISVPVEDTDWLLEYEILGGSVRSATPVDAKTLKILINAASDGKLILTLPRESMDAKKGQDDINFFVLIDGEEVETTELKTSMERVLTIPFSAGVEEIEIIGTHVVPEFGAIAALILSIGIISIVILTTKSRVFPRL